MNIQGTIFNARKGALVQVVVASLFAAGLSVIAAPQGMAATILYVVPDHKTVPYGSTSVNFSAKYTKVDHNLETAIENPAAGNAGWIAPTCFSTPAYVPTSLVGSAVISCSGGNGGTSYTLDYSDTASLTITKVETKVSVTSPQSDSYMPGASLTLAANVSPKSGTGVCTTAVTFALNKNPLTGTSTSYPLTSPVVTTNWLVGDYRLFATYAGDNNCLSSYNNATSIKIGTQPKVDPSVTVSGAGSYLSPYGKASFNLQVKSYLTNFDTSTAVGGKATWSVPKQWKFQGSLNAYTTANGVSTATGNGVLYYWTRGDHKGKWASATSGAANVTVKFTVASGSNRTRPITSFAIGFTGAAVAGAPALPALGALVNVSRGDD